LSYGTIFSGHKDKAFFIFAILKRIFLKKSFLPLTVLIPTYNEAGHLPAALSSAAGAAECLVVDSFSTDGTADLARASGAKIIQRRYVSPADQKNWAIPLATREWVLLLDADERLTPALVKELEALFQAGDPVCDAYHIPRQNYFLGKKIRFSGWQNDAPIRLIRRDRCRFRDTLVHEAIETAGLKVGHLHSPLLHYTCTDLEHFTAKQLRYAHWSALDHEASTPKVTLYHLWAKPAFRFFKHFLLRGGFLDGRAGFQIARLMALGVRWRYEHLRALRTGEVS
jgi:glycosyltransferase involved in cell wall biosynthesis